MYYDEIKANLLLNKGCQLKIGLLEKDSLVYLHSMVDHSNHSQQLLGIQ